MRPVLFEVFGFKVHSYGVMLFIGFVTALWLARARSRRYGVEQGQISDASVWGIILGILGARLVYIAQEWDHYSRNTRELFSLQFQGLTSFGGLIFGMLGLWFWSLRSKVSVIRLFDSVAAPYLLAYAIGRIGCLLNGCCYGGHCDYPWGIHVAGQTGLFHPAQVYDAFFNLAAMGLLFAIERSRQMRVGQTAAIALALHGIARFIYEFWRAGTTSTYMGSLPITDAQAMALVLVLVGISLFIWFRRSNLKLEVPAA
ncbi:MAG TPA: prolipoprotein diacylglyceryl transferase [Fimbriimonadaceae bacterium]|nr:prolipoprotein diacylglyceryl transferase [Fimbriimonadaceae bacterium]